MNGHMAMQSPQMNGRGHYARGAPSYQNYHQGPYSPQGPPTPSGQYSPANYSPRPQYAPSYAMQPPYPPTWPAQQPLSPMPKQLSMPPPMSPNPVLAQPTRHVERSNPPPHPPSPAKSPLPPAAEPEPEPLSQPAADSYVGTVQTTQNSSPSPARKSTFSKGEYVIWSRRPHDPANAPGIIISPLARPPKDVTESAMDLPSPPPTPSPSPPVVLREPSVVQTEIKEPDSSPEAADIQSSSATDTTPACSTAPETPTPASPLSTNTSLSAAPSAAKPVAPAASTPINALPASPLPTVKPAVASKGTPLVDATVEFLKEFEYSGKANGSGKVDGKGKGKEREEDAEEKDMDSFIPTRIYDAMKEKKRFDTMRGGHQEDAEEFLGFYLDTLEEEMLSLANALSPPSKNTEAEGTVEEHEEEEPPEEDGWLEVGKRNRMVVTRTIKIAESPITRMFGGKFRSTLRAPGQKDSSVIEDWRALQLDIQREQIHTVKDALQYISAPSSVQMTSPTRPGVIIDASQQVLIETVPPILVLHMKRFLYDTKVNGVVKIGKQVSFGPELEIAPEIMAGARRGAGAARYKLFGVLYHHGLSASGGHYTLDVLHPNRDHLSVKPREGWVRFDDDLVSDVRPEDVFGGAERDDRCAYLLFYRRIGGGPAVGARTS
ncbi:hypothetical protein HWV62_5764 [Athelia sp. TMB]|nr:hypothetical protein HWV62_5764 [Athelia sp. TMB]